MNQAQMAGLFQPFNRLGREATAVPGTGIGLVIARSLAEAMGGSLVVSSEAGLGSEFTLTLPAASPGLEPSPGASLAALPTLARGDITGHVLYIDDHEVNRILMEAFLTRRPGVTLELAADGESGLLRALARPPRLVLLDIQLPGMDGFQILQALRATPALREVTCLAVSADAMPDDIQRARAAGFDGYLTKPLHVTTLLAEIDRWLAPGA